VLSRIDARGLPKAPKKTFFGISKSWRYSGEMLLQNAVKSCQKRTRIVMFFGMSFREQQQPSFPYLSVSLEKRRYLTGGRS
jgi:hypothetical protein